MNDSTMFEKLTDLNIRSDMGMYYCGKRVRTPNHEYGPEIRTHYLFVLVNEGRAVILPDKQLTFGKHDLLVMFPNHRIHYKALEDWSISWLGLYGETVSEYINLLKVTPQNPIMHISNYNELKTVMDNIYNLSNDSSLASKLSAIGSIYDFFAILMQNSNITRKPDIISTALKIIDYNFCSDITIEKIARLLNVDSAHFSRKFSQKMHLSPKTYILNKRIQRAKELLCTTDDGIFEISNSVGYEDQFYFCRIFKKYTGLSPSEYRRKKPL